MSASNQKKTPSDQTGGLNKRETAKLEEEKKSRKFRRSAIITVVVVVIVLALAIFINSSFFYTKTTAVQIGDTSYTADEFSYYYRSAYSAFLSQYGDYAGYFIDSNTSLEKQACTFSTEEGVTWADYFTESALSEMKRVTALYDEAMANGYTATEDILTNIENDITSSQYYAAMYGYSTDAYLALTFGKGMDEDYYRQVITKYYTALGYAQSIYNSYTYTEEQCTEYYPEIADLYDQITYHSYLCGTTLDKYAELSDEEKVTAAHADAEEIATATTQQEFADKVLEMIEEDARDSYTGIDYTLTTTSGQNLTAYSTDYDEWLLSPDRKAGDTCVVDSDNGSYAIMFVSRDDNSYKLVNARHILVNAEANEDGEYTEEALEAARTKAEEIYAEWKENPTEENFAELANEYSEDTGSNTNGGLYENIVKNQMVEEFNDFCFGSRKAGDTEIVYGSNGSYAGYHIIYFVGEGPVYSTYLAENTLRSNDYDLYEANLVADYPVTTKFAFKFADRG